MAMLSYNEIDAMTYKINDKLICSIAVAHGLRYVVWSLRSLLGPSGVMYLGGKLVDANWIMQLSIGDRKILDAVWRDTFGTMPVIHTCMSNNGVVLGRYIAEQAITAL